jgi:16S rRNA (uracil1498-N3)-methyltransferase
MAAPRFYLPFSLSTQSDQNVDFSLATTRHAQVLRLQPGDSVTVFDGAGGEWSAVLTAMGRAQAQVKLIGFNPVSRELPQPLTLAVCMPANDRMDTLIEKATELGVAAIQPLISERSVLRLDGERAIKKVAHWQGVAVAAAEQSGRTRIPTVFPICLLRQWWSVLPNLNAERKFILAPSAGSSWHAAISNDSPTLFLSGPEGGFSTGEVEAAMTQGFAAVHLGPRILRADTAPLAVLCAWALHSERETAA